VTQKTFNFSGWERRLCRSSEGPVSEKGFQLEGARAWS